MVADMEITATGDIRRHKFYPAVMHSRARLTYNAGLGAGCPTGGGDSDPRAKDLLPHLQDLYALYKVLDRRARDARGAIDFETVELQLSLRRAAARSSASCPCRATTRTS